MLVKSRLLWVAAIALGTISLPLEGAEVSLPKPGQNWIEVETANFRFFSNAGRQATRRVAVDLEELRAVLSELTDYDLQAPIPTYIYVFRGDRSFLPYKTLYEGEPAAVSGYFIAADNANYIAVNADAKDASAIVYHEYVHYVANNNMWYLPVWFSEGLAEFYETFEVSGDTVYIGLPVLRHLIYARQSTPIPLEELGGAKRRLLRPIVGPGSLSAPREPGKAATSRAIPGNGSKWCCRRGCISSGVCYRLRFNGARAQRLPSLVTPALDRDQGRDRYRQKHRHPKNELWRRSVPAR
jgi:hypothetical protein